MGTACGKIPDEEASYVHPDQRSPGGDDHAVGEISNEKIGIFARMEAWENWLDVKLGIENQGVRRVRNTERQSPNLWVMLIMWSSTGTYSIAGLTTGLIPWDYGLSLSQGIGILALGSVIGAASSVSAS